MNVKNLPPEILADLKKAVQLSFDKDNLVPHTTVKKEVKTLLKAKGSYLPKAKCQ